MSEDAHQRAISKKNAADAKKSSSGGKPAGSDAGTNNPPAGEAEAAQAATENSNRVDAAKAFYRAIYAGEEADAEKYGMKVETINKQNSETGSCVNCDQLASEFEQAQAKTAEIEGLYKRMAADFDNYRKRIEREREDLVSIGVQKAVEALLPALDDLDRAQANFNNNSELANVLESIKLISARFSKCLEQLGIKPLEPIGQHFDPRLHEPVQKIATTEVPEGTVVHDLRRGYALGEKVIRPTLVNVASAGNSDQESDDQPQASADSAENSQ